MINFNIPLHIIILGIAAFGAVQGMMIGLLMGIFKVTNVPRTLVLVALVTFIESFVWNVVLTGDLDVGQSSRSGVLPIVEATHGAVIGAMLIIVPNMLMGVGTVMASKFIMKSFKRTLP